MEDSKMQPSIVFVILGDDQKPILSLWSNGMVEAPTVEGASEAAQIFVDTVRKLIAADPLSSIVE